ncbi:MAG: SPOR domain-containing protein [Desulfarculales bacterium]|nr:SPOR domain-containing protein [Desulfarculales bacterium]
MKLIVTCRPRWVRSILNYPVWLIILGLGLSLQSAPWAAAVSPSHYAVQVGVFVGPVQSNRLAETLSLAGYAAWVEERPRLDDKVRYYVLVGPFTAYDQARESLQAIAGKFKVDPLIIDLDQY